MNTTKLLGNDAGFNSSLGSNKVNLRVRPFGTDQVFDSRSLQPTQAGVQRKPAAGSDRPCYVNYLRQPRINDHGQSTTNVFVRAARQARTNVGWKTDLKD